jgi:thiol-disulfide isomerase/thioredoxin
MLRPCLVLALASIALVGSPPTASTKQPVVEGEVLTFRLSDLEGDIVSSAAEPFENRVVLVTLWGTWCPPCVSEIPTLNRLQRAYAEAGLVVVAIAFEKEPNPDVRRRLLRDFVAQHRIRYSVLDGGTTDEFSKALPQVNNVKGLPVEIIIDRTGTVADCRSGRGYSKAWARKLEKRLVALLDEAP